MERLESA